MGRTWDVLNLGAGVGSTTVYLLMHRGELPPVDAAVFADTGEEPAPVYAHLAWLETLGRPPILRGGRGKLGDGLVNGCNAAGRQRKKGRFTSLPAFTATYHADRPDPTAPPDPKEIGRNRRQCTREYKIEVAEQVIRRELLKLKRRQRWPKDVLVRQHFGLTDDEPARVRAVRARFRRQGRGEPVFPLATLGMTRADCVAYLAPLVPHTTPRSACTFCPYRDPLGWEWLKQHDAEGWRRAVEIDRAIRDPASRATLGMRHAMYLHRSCLPLELVDIEGEAAAYRARVGEGAGQRDLFSLFDTGCDAGHCGV